MLTLTGDESIITEIWQYEVFTAKHLSGFVLVSLFCYSYAVCWVNNLTMPVISLNYWKSLNFFEFHSNIPIIFRRIFGWLKTTTN